MGPPLLEDLLRLLARAGGRGGRHRHHRMAAARRSFAADAELAHGAARGLAHRDGGRDAARGRRRGAARGWRSAPHAGRCALRGRRARARPARPPGSVQALAARARRLPPRNGKSARRPRSRRARTARSYLLFTPLKASRAACGGRRPPLRPGSCITVGIATSLAFSALLAWYLARPIRSLRWAFGSAAAGSPRDARRGRASARAATRSPTSARLRPHGAAAPVARGRAAAPAARRVARAALAARAAAGRGRTGAPGPGEDRSLARAHRARSDAPRRDGRRGRSRSRGSKAARTSARGRRSGRLRRTWWRRRRGRALRGARRPAGSSPSGRWTGCGCAATARSCIARSRTWCATR